MVETRVTAAALAERADSDELAATYRLWAEEPAGAAILDAVGGPAMLLNKQRQMVYANEALVTWLGAASPSALLGVRPGEALTCLHASETAAGCGTTPSCRQCGALNAILTAQLGNGDVQECRILRTDGDAWDLRVWAKPLVLKGYQFTVFSLVDIADEKRRRVLERVFFHDVLNTSGAIRSIAELLPPEDCADDELTDLLKQAADRLVEEIEAQRDLLAVESGDLEPDVTEQDSFSLLESWMRLYAVHPVGQGKVLKVADNAASVRFVSDGRLVGRVLGNLIKNALEAGGPGAVVTAGCDAVDGGVRFWVHNAAVMPPQVQSQIFKRSFTTKGAGRGLGTYSVKLLSERYLGGTVGFASTAEGGTMFHIALPVHLQAS